jgi:hypothetical protein
MIRTATGPLTFSGSLWSADRVPVALEVTGTFTRSFPQDGSGTVWRGIVRSESGFAHQLVAGEALVIRCDGQDDVAIRVTDVGARCATFVLASPAGPAHWPIWATFLDED